MVKVRRNGTYQNSQHCLDNKSSGTTNGYAVPAALLDFTKNDLVVVGQLLDEALLVGVLILFCRKFPGENLKVKHEDDIIIR